jgi:transposase
MVRLPGRLWPAYDDLQPLQSLVPQTVLDQSSQGAGRRWRDHQKHIDRFNLCEGPARRLWRKRGAKAQDIGPSRGGQTTKIHALTDVLGRPFALLLTPGNVSDITVADDLIKRAVGLRYLIADKGYDADALRKSLRKAGTVPVIPGRANRKRKVRYDKARYMQRHLIENAFCRLKDFRRIATRYDKLSRNFLSAVALATILAYWI